METLTEAYYKNMLEELLLCAELNQDSLEEETSLLLEKIRASLDNE